MLEEKILLDVQTNFNEGKSHQYYRIKHTQDDINIKRISNKTFFSLERGCVTLKTVSLC